MLASLSSLSIYGESERKDILMRSGPAPPFYTSTGCEAVLRNFPLLLQDGNYVEYKLDEEADAWADELASEWGSAVEALQGILFLHSTP